MNKQQTVSKSGIEPEKVCSAIGICLGTGKINLFLTHN